MAQAPWPIRVGLTACALNIILCVLNSPIGPSTVDRDQPGHLGHRAVMVAESAQKCLSAVQEPTVADRFTLPIYKLSQR